MADFQLQLDVVAQTAKLEAGLKKAEQAVTKTAKVADEAVGKLGGFQAVGKTVAVAAAAMAGFESAVSLATAALGVMSGDAEQVRASLESLPIFGGLIARTFQFEEALHASSKRMQEATAEALRLDAAMRKLESRSSTLASNLNLQAEQMKLLGRTDLEIAIEQQEGRIRLIEQETQIAINAAQQRAKERRKELEEANISAEQRLQLIEEINKETSLEIVLLQGAAQTKKENLGLEIASLKAAEEAAAIARQEEEAAKREQAIAERKSELEKAAEKHQKEIMRLEEEANNEREAAAEAQRKAQEDLLAFTNKRLEMEQEIAEARAEAERQVAGATATFATAGGSFTAGVSAQVNEAKLLTKISQQSRDFLAQIVQNTMSLPGVLSLG